MNNQHNGTPGFVLTSMRYQQAAITATTSPEMTGKSIIKFDYCLPPKNSGNKNRSRKG